MELRAGRPPGAQVLLPRREPPPLKLPGWTAGGSSSSSGSCLRSKFHQGVATPAVLCTLHWACRRRWRGRTVAYNFPPGLELDTSPDIADRPEKRMVKELSRYEDPDDPVRPQAPPRDRKALWAPPGPRPISAPEVLVVGLGRRLRADEDDGPRARLGAGAVEALQRRYQIRTFFDADVQGYVATCRASLDKSGRAGVQKIHLMQPLVEHDTDVAHALEKMMAKPRLDKAMVLFVLSDPRLPFGQLRMRSAFDSSNPWLRSAYAALGPGNRVTCLYVGAGSSARSQAFLAAEETALPTVLCNAATAIEVWLSEADLGLVMRFVNRPEVYEMPPGWPYAHQVLEDTPTEALPEAVSESESDSQDQVVSPEEHANGHDEGSAIVPQSLIGASPGEYVLFDLNRDNVADIPDVMTALMSPASALAALQERPQSEAIIVAGRKYASFMTLKNSLVEVLLEQEPGMHLRFQDDEEAMKALLSYHPEADRLLEDLVAIKVDCSPVDDDTRCLWVIKFDGYEEDVSLQACFEGLEKALHLDAPQGEGVRPRHFVPRLGPGRWRNDVQRETAFQRAEREETLGITANK